MPESRIGTHCHIGQNVVVQPGVIVGNGCRILNNVTLYSGVICEQDVFLGPSCTFTNVINPRAFISRKKEFQATLIKQGASIGANATILCGTTIGSYALIGAGSVVTKDVPDYAIVTGNPARQAGWISRDGFQLSFEEAKAFCQEENRFYQLNIEDGTVKPV
jgi:UDP-2-acetamido-3-amino-2,3-dideoxy-glucuronate N-acetyltransferase